MRNPYEVFSHEYFMMEALKQAHLAFEAEEIPVGAIVVCENKIIAKAYNQVELLNDPTAHAEILAITSAANHIGSKYLDECVLYVTLEPCTMCIGATYWAQLKEIYYAASDPKLGFTTKNDSLTHPKTKVHKGLLEPESSQLLDRFFAKLRDNK